MDDKLKDLCPDLDGFRSEMEAKLERDAHKGDAWKRDIPESLMSLLVGEVEELQEALEELSKANSISAVRHALKNIRQEAADVGNFAAMIWDNAKNRWK